MHSIGIIGAGIVGERIIKQIQQDGKISINGVYDENPERLAFLHKTYDVPISESLKAVLHSEIDWLYIGTPPASHAAIAKLAASAGINVLSEKPLAYDAAAGFEMVEAAENNRIQTAMHFPLMYKPEVHEMVRRIREGEIGKIKRVELQTVFPDWPRDWQQNLWIASRSQGGFVREVFPHYLQLINRIFGGLTIQHHLITYPEQADLCETSLLAHGMTTDDTSVLLSGLSGVGQKELLQFKVFGENGVLTLENWSNLYEEVKNQERREITDFPKVPTLFESMRQQSTLLVSFTEGQIVQQQIDHLLSNG